MVYITSDLHFFHDREFIYKPRGFQSVEEMNNAYLREWKEKVKEYDDIYVLGDFCLGGDYDKIKNLVETLPGRIHLIVGNHDSERKLQLYATCKNIASVKYADMLKSRKRSYYLSHYITLTSSLECNPKNCVVNLHGHIHTANKFHEDRPYLYNVSVDANANHFVTLEEIETTVNQKIKECLTY